MYYHSEDLRETLSFNFTLHSGVVVGDHEVRTVWRKVGEQRNGRVERLDAVDCEYHVTASQIICTDWTWKRVGQFMYMADAYIIAGKSRYCIDGYLTFAAG